LSAEEKRKLTEVSKLESEIQESERIAASYDYKLDGFQKSLDSLKYGLPSVLELLEIDHSHHLKVDDNKEKYLDINDKNLSMLVKYLSSVEERTNGIIELYNLFQNRQVKFASGWVSKIF
jgi:predicted glycosyltransferase involved in capsule biosynthesis